MRNIYLAGPFFNEQQIALEEQVYEQLKQNETVNQIFRPCKHQDQNAFDSEPWRRNTFLSDINQIRMCDIIVAIVDFLEVDGEVIPDPGTVWELGFGYALGKPLVLVNAQNYQKINLMLERSYTKAVLLDELATLDFINLRPDLTRPLECI